MRCKNHVTLRGYVGRDPEIRALNGGAKVAVINLGMTEKWKDRETGEPREHTEWARVVVWPEQLVSLVERYIKKGSAIEVDGKLATRKFTDNGVEKTITEVVLDGPKADIELMDPPKNGDGAQQRDQSQQDKGGQSRRTGSGRGEDPGHTAGQGQARSNGGRAPDNRTGTNGRPGPSSNGGGRDDNGWDNLPNF